MPGSSTPRERFAKLPQRPTFHLFCNQAPSSTASSSSLITSEWCQQFNPNPVRFTILLLTLLIFAPTTLPSRQGEKSTPQTLGVKLNLPSKGQSTSAGMTEKMQGCTSQLDTQARFLAPASRPWHHAQHDPLALFYTHTSVKELKFPSTVHSQFQVLSGVGGFQQLFFPSANYLVRCPSLRYMLSRPSLPSIKRKRRRQDNRL